MRMLKTALITLAVMATLPAFAQDSSTIKGLGPGQHPLVMQQTVTPDTYKTLPVEARQFYVAGVLDTESYFRPEAYAPISGCVKGKSAAQLMAMVDEGLASMPPGSIGAMPQNVHNAIDVECSRH
jgi:hypothetical protein